MKQTKHYFFTFLLFFYGCFVLTAQSKLPLKKVLKDISEVHKIQFNYNSSLVDSIEVFQPLKTASLTSTFKEIESQTSLIFTEISSSIFTVSKAYKICGYIKEFDTKAPLENATIITQYSNTISNENGFFELKLRFPSEKITIRYLGYGPVKTDARFFTNSTCKTILLEEKKEVITPVSLTGYLVKGIDKVNNANITIDFSKFSLLPGLIEADVLQSVQALPGIQSADETVSNINIRGGSHDQNLILWDGIKMYQTGHFFGLISSFNPQITQKATVINNGTDASLSDGVSGTIHMKSNNKIQKRFKASFSLNFINGNAFVDVPLGEKSSLQIAARKSIDDIVRTPTYNNYFERVTQNTEVDNNLSNVTNANQEFSFYDTSLRWLYKPSENDEIRLNFILIDNNLTFDETASNNNSIETRQSSLSQNTIAGGISYQRNWNENFSTQLKVYETDYKLQAINANIFDNQRFLQENVVSETGLMLKSNYNKSNWLYGFGYNFTESKITNLSDVDNPRFLRLRSDVIREHAVFAQTEFESPNKDFIIKPGLRINYIEKFKKTLIEPRIAIKKNISNTIATEILGEFKHQNVSQIINFQNDFLGIEKRRWQLSDNDSIPILKSKQLSLGISYNKKSLLLDAKGYFKKVDGITTQSQSFTTKYEFEKEKGSYKVWGAEFLARKKLKNLNTWLSYSFLNNTYSFDNLDDKKFPSNFDFTHTITLGSTYTNKDLKFSAGFNYQTGKPTSIPLANNEIVDNTINYDVANNTRLNNYFRIDASATYKWRMSPSLGTDFGISVWNLSGNKNAINNYYRITNNEATKFSRFSLGTTVNALIRFYIE